MLVRLLDLTLISPIERRFNQKPILDVLGNKFSSFLYHEVLIVFTKTRCHISHLQTVFPNVYFNIVCSKSRCALIKGVGSDVHEQDWNRLILFANIFCRSAGEMFLMYIIIAVFNSLSVRGRSRYTAYFAAPNRQNSGGVSGNFSANCPCTKSVYLMPSRKTYSTRKHVPQLKEPQ